MIFVTVGTSPSSFTRLVKAMDTLASWIDEAVVIQQGSCLCALRHSSGQAWMDAEMFQAHMLSARIIVSHAGADTVLPALKQGKPLVLVPRSAKWQECADDHQFELANALQRQRQALMVEDIQPATLWNAITYSPMLSGAPVAGQMLRETLTDQLVEWETSRTATGTLPGWKG